MSAVIYLHGFASSPASSKAQQFAAEFARRGVPFSRPDFNEPSFETLTISRMLDQTARVIDEMGEIDAAGASSVVLIGSSLGAFVALHAAAREDERARTGGTPPGSSRIAGLILLAPALDFGGNRLRQLGEHGIDEWRRRGTLNVFHYGLNRPTEVGFALYEDAARYDAHALDVPWPTLVFQGRQDDAVDPKMVAGWAASRPSVDLRLVDDGHQLTASMPDIWRATETFLESVTLKR